MRLIIVFLMLSTQVSAQHLIFVPDVNLRSELNTQGFLTNDSLDTRKTGSRLVLELNNKGIENLDGLQYFDRVWRLFIGSNKIKQLDNLPPNLTYLICVNNEISQIDNLPRNLKYLNCGDNKISNIVNLPPHLTWLDFSYNLMKNLPQLPQNLKHLNYSNNPIPLDSLPALFQSISCDHHSQNCLPYELMNWKILNAKIQDTSLEITGMSVKLKSSYSWGAGRQIETMDFKLEKTKLVADKVRVKREYPTNIQPKKYDSVSYNDVNYSVEASKIKQLLKDIYSNKMRVKVQVGDSLKLIDLKTKKNGRTCAYSCSDCTSYSLRYTIYSQTGTIQLDYGFESLFDRGVTICSTNGPEDLKSILDWLYVYKLTNLTFEEHPMVTAYFTPSNLAKVIEWAK